MGRPTTIRFQRNAFELGRPHIVGVINVTPDSFSDGGSYETVDAAVRFGLRCVTLGADWLDIGGESTRPQNASAVSCAEQTKRVVPVISELAKQTRVVLSVDTTSAEVAAAAILAGAEVVNDISGGRFDRELVDVVDKSGVGYVLGHARGRNIDEMHSAEQNPPTFDEILDELRTRVEALPDDVRQRTIVDPGLGFGKGLVQNIEILQRLGELSVIGRPVMVGPSRKRFLGDIVNRPVDDRDDATVGACLAAVQNGADFVRVHDVKKVHDALRVFARCTGGWVN